jgi:prolyl oligopeptidase
MRGTAATCGKKRAMFDPASDPYAYLEDSSAPETIAWTADANRATRAALDALPGRPVLEARFEALTRIDAQGVPVVRGGRAFYTARRGEADQTSLYVRDAAGERILLDPAALDPSGLTALDWWYPSPRGRYVAFGLSQGGDERSRLFVLEVATLERLAEAIPDTRHCSLAWLPDERGFYYTRYPAGADYDVRVYRHALGAPWESEPALFGEGRKAEEWTALDLSENGTHLVATVYDGWARSDVLVAATAEQPLSFRPVAVGLAAVYEAHAGDAALYLRTDDGAPHYRVYEVEYARLERSAWREIVPEEEASLDGVALAGNALLLHYFVAARSELRIRYPSGNTARIDLGGRSVLALSAAETDPEAYVSSSSFLEAAVITKLRIGEGETSAEPWFEVAVPFDARRYDVEQVWYTSRDGTAIPMTILARSDIARDGTAPAVLYGYGGFNVSLVPSFLPSIVPWLDSGGIYAVANLRGGGEFGEAWHRAGMRERKQNVFDDFIAAAEYLGTSGRADPRRIAISGGSNGGLLVAAVAVQRPDLVRAVLCLVPLTDMLRFHLFSIARLWIAEYGDPDAPDDAAFLRAYSPYHNVRDGVAYPAMLVATAEADGRVDPMHARKFGARVRSATGGSAPILVYVEPDAGHGAGKPRHKRVAELADHWAFIAWQLGQVLR